jgi:ribonuclease BN (tRNA processing enzyme)
MAESTGIKTISLTNDGHLALFFIGAGSAFSKKNYQTNLLIVKGDTHILVDCGTRAPEALSRAGLPVTAIKRFFITHSHADHIGGLEEVMLVNRYGPKVKPEMVISEEYEEYLWSNSLKGGAAYNERTNGRILHFDDFWVPLRPQKSKTDDRYSHIVVGGNLDLTIFRTKHIPDSAKSWADSAVSNGILIDGKVLFTSDTRFDPELIQELEKKYKLEKIFHDCQFFTGGVHASLDELNTLPPATKAKTWLVHYGDNYETKIDAAREMGFAGFVEPCKEY